MSRRSVPPGPSPTDLGALCTTCVRDARVDGGGVTVLSRSGTPVALHATDEVSATVEDLQFTLGEGPCVEAIATRSPVLVADLADRRAGGSRWPAFHAEATSMGIGAIFAFPVRVGSVSLGTLDLYRRAPGPLSGRQLEATNDTVDTLGRQLLDMDTPSLEDDHDRYPMTVHQAAGMVMIQLGCDIDEALVRIRATAYAEHVEVRALAGEVVAGRRRFGEEPT